MEKTSNKGEDSNTTPTDDNISLNEVKKCKSFFSSLFVCVFFLSFALFLSPSLSPSPSLFSRTRLMVFVFAVCQKIFGTKLWHQNVTHKQT